MKLKRNIELEDPRYCEGCPCLNVMCECKYYDLALKTTDPKITYGEKAVRLYKCISENGK